MDEVKRFSEDFEHIGRTVNQNDRLLIENSLTGEENYVKIADIDPANATVLALEAADNAPKTITLLSITTLPDPRAISTGSTAYQASDKKIYTVVEVPDSDSIWDAGATPRVQDVHLFSTGRYEWISNDLILTNKSISGNSRISGTGASGTTDTYRTTYSDGTHFDYTVVNGNGVASITRTSGNGAPGTDDTYTITFTNETTTTFVVHNGSNGTNGTNGRGVSSITRTSGTGAAGTTDTYTILFTDSTTTTFNVVNGANGTGATVVQTAGTSTGSVVSQKTFSDNANLFNVTTQVPLSAGSYYNPATAKAAVPSEYRKIGGVITYVTALKEVDTLTVTGAATADGNITITLNGVAFTVAVLNGDSESAIGDKIRATAMTGWTVGGTGGTAVVTFTKTAIGVCSIPLFSAASTGVIATFFVTTYGTTETWVTEQYIGLSTSSTWTTQDYWIKSPVSELNKFVGINNAFLKISDSSISYRRIDLSGNIMTEVIGASVVYYTVTPGEKIYLNWKTRPSAPNLVDWGSRLIDWNIFGMYSGTTPSSLNLIAGYSLNIKTTDEGSSGIITVPDNAVLLVVTKDPGAYYTNVYSINLKNLIPTRDFVGIDGYGDDLWDTGMTSSGRIDSGGYVAGGGYSCRVFTVSAGDVYSLTAINSPSDNTNYNAFAVYSGGVSGTLIFNGYVSGNYKRRQVRIPTGGDTLVINMFYGAIKHLVYKSEVFKEIGTLKSNVPTKADDYFWLRKGLNASLVGNNIFPDPYLNLSVLFGLYNSNNGVFNITAPGNFAFADDGKGVSFSTTSEILNEFTDSVIGKSFKISGTPNASNQSYNCNLGIAIKSSYLLSLGYTTGDTLKFGFKAKNNVTNGNLCFNVARGSFTNSVDKNNLSHWIETEPVVINLSNSSVTFGFSVSNGLGTAGYLELFISNLCVKNITKFGAWVGFEENTNASLLSLVNAAIASGVTPVVTSVLAAKTAAITDLASETNYGYGVSNFVEKMETLIHTFGKPASSINVVVYADSIWGTFNLVGMVATWLNTKYGIPTANVNRDCCYGGYTVDQYVPCVDYAVKCNADLVIISEDTGTHFIDAMVRLLRAKTNADIMIGTFTRHGSYPERMYREQVDIAHNYGCEVIDIRGMLERKYIDEGALNYQLDGIHLNPAGETMVLEDFKKHFYSTRFYPIHNQSTRRIEVLYLVPQLCMPAMGDGITFSGSWLSNFNTEGNTYIKSSTIGDYIEIPFTGVGFEINTLTSGATNNHTILIDGVAPSTLALEYCSMIVGKSTSDSQWWFHRFFAAYVTTPFMTNDETEIEFEIKVNSITRNGSNVITGMVYTLSQNGTSLGTGNINTDSIFTFRGGQIHIPAKVYGFANIMESTSGDPNIPGSGYNFYVNDIHSFKVRKTWKDTFNSATTPYVQISGLTRGNHTLRITKNSAVESQVRYVCIYK